MRFAAVIAISTALAGLGCSGESSTFTCQPCDSIDECAGGLLCKLGYCVNTDQDPRRCPARTADSGVVAQSDAGSPVPDATVQGPDASAPGLDGSTPIIDAGSPAPDARAQGPDASAPGLDGSMPLLDAGMRPDAAVAPWDAGSCNQQLGDTCSGGCCGNMVCNLGKCCWPCMPGGVRACATSTDCCCSNCTNGFCYPP